jgi:hypothetical protein
MVPLAAEPNNTIRLGCAVSTIRRVTSCKVSWKGIDGKVTNDIFNLQFYYTKQGENKAHYCAMAGVADRCVGVENSWEQGKIKTRLFSLANKTAARDAISAILDCDIS